MTKRKLSVLLVALTIIISMLLASCGSSPKTLEEIIQNDKEAAAEIENFGEEAGLTVDIKGNEIIYTMDLAQLGVEITDEMADLFKETLASDEYVKTFSDVCKQLEDELEVLGVTVTVTYANGDNVVATNTFNADGLVE